MSAGVRDMALGGGV